VKAWKIILIPTLITLAIGGIYLFSVWKHRQNPGVIAKQDTNETTLSKDDLVVMRAFFPQHFDDLQRLEGTTVWMKDGYAISYFPYVGGHVDFAKRAGVIPATQQMDIKKMIKAVAPAKLDDGLEHGTRQAFAVFELPGNKELFATPLGYMEGNKEAYFSDPLFFYDDPHKIYNYWPQDVWAAIDAHQVKPGMSEAETRMAIGQNMHPDGNTEGDRTVTYNQDGKTWTVTFVKNRATDVKEG
jgi:hypothetical protein